MALESRYGFSLPSVIFRSRTYANLRGSQTPLNPYHSNATDTALPSFPSYILAQRVDRIDDTITALPPPPPPSPPPAPPSPPELKKLKKKQSVLPLKSKPSTPLPNEKRLPTFTLDTGRSPTLPGEKRRSPCLPAAGKKRPQAEKALPKPPPSRPKKPSAWTRIANRIKRGLKSLGRKRASKSPKKRPLGRNVEISGPTNFQHVGGVEVLQRERTPRFNYLDGLRPPPPLVAVIQQREVSPTDSDDEGDWQTEYGGTEYAGTEYARTEYARTEYARTEYAATEYADTIYAGTEYGNESEWEDVVDDRYPRRYI